jgi:putative colanic acid biosynthesis acetyltransferase WcaB
MNNFIKYIFQDWEVNKTTSAKARLSLLMFRLAQRLGRLPKPLSFISIIYRTIYQLFIEWILGIELPWDIEYVGPNLKLHHGQALVVYRETIIGANCTLRHSTSLGNKKLPDGSYSASPRIGNNVDIGSNVVIIGPITIGDNAVIGAGSVVVKDVLSGAIVAGNPARIIRMREQKNVVHNQEVQEVYDSK